MKNGLYGIALFLAIVVLLPATCLAAADHYALATSANRLYLLWAEGTWGATGSSVLAISDLAGRDIRGVATFGEWVYLLDAASNSILAGKLTMATGPTDYGFDILQTIRLENADRSLRVNLPYSLSVDAEGGVYVIGGKYTSGGATHSSYAYVTGITAGSATVTVADLLNSTMTDVAAYGSAASGGSHAVIPHVLSSGVPQASYLSKVNKAGASGPVALTGHYNPGTVAVVSGLGSYSIAYVLSRLSSPDPQNPYGSLDVIRLDTMARIAEYTFDALNLNPQDITTTEVNGTHYLAIVGRTMSYSDDEDNPGIVYGAAKALKVALDGAGVPQFATQEVRDIPKSDNVAGHVMEVSGDGQVVWSVYPDGTQKVEAWKFNSWSGPEVGTFSGTVSDTLNNIANLIGLPVPEPSSYAAMLSMLGGMAFFARRRGRR